MPSSGGEQVDDAGPDVQRAIVAASACEIEPAVESDDVQKQQQAPELDEAADDDASLSQWVWESGESGGPLAS